MNFTRKQIFFILLFAVMLTITIKIFEMITGGFNPDKMAVCTWAFSSLAFCYVGTYLRIRR